MPKGIGYGSKTFGKEKAKKTVGMGDIGGKLPPPPTKAEMKKMDQAVAKKQAEAAKPKPKAAKKPVKNTVTGMKTRRKLAKEAMEG